MNKFLAFVAEELWKHLQPWLEAKWNEVKPKIFEFIKEQFKEWMPKIMQTVVVTLSESAGQLVVNSADKITDVIPGQVDDVIVDRLVNRARNALKQFGIEF
ncbi:hypothetical protein CL65_gp041 [Mycobacterium phage Patience]|uniref:Uncharacterized protein n=2 Tax=Patiencevirus patience TaxID=1982360 RepID=A0A0K1LT36_9CAUD|nr:hypothetical protein CL65_gp041 [Mycobacterium phage Patience]AEL97949.1 hypothetical protein PATIENCE_40 [Mycobacterium phage Patience]AKU45328.1 hypothetical protein MADRUGA_38 [Mycobacterium phage Madruga]UOW93365.1 hypothetical protein SEA_LABELLE_39 [Mycobacterium phage Labelle]